MRRAGWWWIAAAAAVAGCTGGDGGSSRPPASTAAFRAIEQEIFAPRCVHEGCHGGENPAAGLDLEAGHAYDNLVGVAASRRPQRLRVDPGNPDGSYLLERLTAGGDTPRMPLGSAPLSDAELETLRAWIREGAKR